MTFVFEGLKGTLWWSGFWCEKWCPYLELEGPSSEQFVTNTIFTYNILNEVSSGLRSCNNKYKQALIEQVRTNTISLWIANLLKFSNPTNQTSKLTKPLPTSDYLHNQKVNFQIQIREGRGPKMDKSKHFQTILNSSLITKHNPTNLP